MNILRRIMSSLEHGRKTRAQMNAAIDLYQEQRDREMQDGIDLALSRKTSGKYFLVILGAAVFLSWLFAVFFFAYQRELDHFGGAGLIRMVTVDRIEANHEPDLNYERLFERNQ